MILELRAMQRRRASTALLLCAVLLAGTAPAARANTSAPDFSRIDAYVQSMMAQAPIPGLAYGVIKHDQILYLNGFGKADESGRAVTAQTPFVISSVTKTFTTLAIRQLVNAGLLDLSAPVQRYLPWFSVADSADAARITVRMLVNHNSGFSTRDGEQAYLNDPRYSLEDLIRKQATVQLQHKPGYAEYSNINDLVLGAIIERLSGVSYDEYVKANIWEPLQMRHSYTSQAEAARDGLASGYRPWFGLMLPAQVEFPAAMHAAGYLISSAEDMAHFMIAYYNDGRYGAGSVLAPRGYPAPGAPPSGYFYDGYWNLQPGPVQPGSSWSQSGGSVNYNSDLLLAQDDELGVIVLLNSRQDMLIPGVSAFDIASGIKEMMQGRQPAAPADKGYRLGWLMADAFLLALLAFTVAQLWRLRRWGKALARPALRPLRQVILPLLLDLLIALPLVFVVPLLFDRSWEMIWQALPDLTLVLLGCGLALLLVALTKAGLAVARLWSRRQKLASVPA